MNNSENSTKKQLNVISLEYLRMAAERKKQKERDFAVSLYGTNPEKKRKKPFLTDQVPLRWGWTLAGA
jgi:hypothetical protein